MQTNQIWLDDGSDRMDNTRTMEIIIEEFKAFQKRSGNALHGLKVIYCTPRSFSAKLVNDALNECLKFKADSRIGPFIAGFDLVGEEGKGKPL